MNNLTKTLRSGEVIFKDVKDYQKHLERIIYIVVGNVASKRFVSKNKAYELYGGNNVKLWIKSGLVNEIKDGDGKCKIRLSMTELESAAMTSNRCEYFNLNN